MRFERKCHSRLVLSQICDVNNNGSLDEEEFAKCCRLNNLGLSPSDVSILLKYFDKDGSGSVGYEEFLRALRGRLNPTRKHLVKKIFDVLDKCASAVMHSQPLPYLPALNSQDLRCATGWAASAAT